MLKSTTPAMASGISFIVTPSPVSSPVASRGPRLRTRSRSFHAPKRLRARRLYPAAVTPTPESSLFQTNEIVNGYKIISQLGRGANGITYECTSRERSGPLALKALPLSALASWKALDLFEREAKTLRSLSHPAIPEYIDFFQLDRQGDAVFALVQRKATGKSLQTLLDEGKRFTTEEVRLVFTQLLEVLQYLSNLNPPVLHRDIKPSNVILDESNGMVSLVDFGGVNTGRPGSTMVGTFGYMSPEQFSGSGDVRSDLYAVAATILNLLTAQAPASLPQKRLRFDLDSVIPARERLKLGNVYTVMARLLEPAPEDRYDSVAAALSALKGSPKRESSEAADSSGLGIGSGGALSPEEVVSLTEAFANITPLKPGAFNMISGWARGKRRKPAGSRVNLERDAESRLLRISVPPRGLSGDALSRGAFTVAWTGFTAFWTLGVITGGAPLVFSLFSIPFFAVGARMARQTADEVAGVSNLVLSFGGGEKEVFYFGLSSKGPLGRGRVVEGDPRDIDRAVLETEMYVNGRPVTALVINEGTRRHSFGGGLDPVEQEWLRDEINDFLSNQNRW